MSEYRTNLPVIDIHKKANESEIEKLSDRWLSRPTSGKELSKIPVGTPILYEQNPDSSKVKRPKWCNGTIKDRKEPRNYKILTDNDKIVTRLRH